MTERWQKRDLPHDEQLRRICAPEQGDGPFVQELKAFLSEGLAPVGATAEVVDLATYKQETTVDLADVGSESFELAFFVKCSEVPGRGSDVSKRLWRGVGVKRPNFFLDFVLSAHRATFSRWLPGVKRPILSLKGIVAR